MDEVIEFVQRIVIETESHFVVPSTELVQRDGSIIELRNGQFVVTRIS